MKLRGKKLITENPKENFTKVPNQIFTADLNPTEKLILMRLHYYPAEWVLAYTRVGKELGLRDDTMIKWWNSLKNQQIIIENGDSYQIDYSMIPQSDIKYSSKYQLKNTTENVVKTNTTNSVKRSNNTTNSVVTSTTKNVDDLLRKTELTTTNSVVTEEETKEEDYNNKTNNKTHQKIENHLGEDITPIYDNDIDNYFQNDLFITYWKNATRHPSWVDKKELIKIPQHERLYSDSFQLFTKVKKMVDGKMTVSQ